MTTLDQRVLSATRPEMARTRSLIADRFVSPREWDALVREQLTLAEQMPYNDLAEGVRSGVFVSVKQAAVKRTPADSLSKSLRKLA